MPGVPQKAGRFLVSDNGDLALSEDLKGIFDVYYWHIKSLVVSKDGCAGVMHRAAYRVPVERQSPRARSRTQHVHMIQEQHLLRVFVCRAVHCIHPQAPAEALESDAWRSVAIA